MLKKDFAKLCIARLKNEGLRKIARDILDRMKNIKKKKLVCQQEDQYYYTLLLQKISSPQNGVVSLGKDNPLNPTDDKYAKKIQKLLKLAASSGSQHDKTMAFLSLCHSILAKKMQQLDADKMSTIDDMSPFIYTMQ